MRTADKSPVFITRRFPPSVGGMETLAEGVWRSIVAVRPDAVLIAHGGTNRALPLWLARAWLRLAWLIWRGRVDFVLTGDAPVFAAVWLLARMGRVRAATMTLGLDVTFPNALYRRLVVSSLKRCDHVIAISAATRDAAVSVGVPKGNVSVLRLGVPVPEVAEGARPTARTRIMQMASLPNEAVPIVTLGRLVQRKGVAWFVREVLARLPSHVHYVVAGSGPEEGSIRAAAASADVEARVHLLGPVSNEERDILMAGGAIFVQPNISVPGDMEGFGLVTVEAALRGTPVVAADLEGIKDAVLPGETGILVPSGDAGAWARTLAGLLSSSGQELDDMGRRFRTRATQLFSESSMGARLLAMLSVAPPGGSGECDE